jgi:hypothetical protein
VVATRDFSLAGNTARAGYMLHAPGNLADLLLLSGRCRQPTDSEVVSAASRPVSEVWKVASQL